MPENDAATPSSDRGLLAILVVVALVCVIGGMWWALSSIDGGGESSTSTTAESGDGPDAAVNGPAAENLVVKVWSSIPHDPPVFTQGVELHEGVLYESAGLKGKSSLRTGDVKPGKTLHAVNTEPEEFAEGLTVLPSGDVVQLTWQDGVAHVRDAKTLASKSTFTYEGEGWGICYAEASNVLFMSDGSSQLTVRDATTFEPLRRVDVTLEGEALTQLNELECTDDGVFANVWQTDTIVRIDPDTGVVADEIDASGLLTEAERTESGADVLNGIADLGDGTFLLSGKLWPKSFIVSFEAAAGAESSDTVPANG